MNSCLECGACCRWLFVPYRKDLHKWAILHRGHMIREFFAFPTPCLAQIGNKCDMYANRPKTCSDFKKGSRFCLLSRELEGLK